MHKSMLQAKINKQNKEGNTKQQKATIFHVRIDF